MNRLIMMIINDQNNDQAYAERNTEGLEDRTWEQALAPRLKILIKNKNKNKKTKQKKTMTVNTFAAKWWLTLSPSTPGFTCGQGCARYSMMIMMMTIMMIMIMIIMEIILIMTEDDTRIM